MEPRNPFPKQQRHRHARWAWVGILSRLLLSLVLLLQSAGIGQAAPVAVPGEAPLATAAMQEPPAAEGLFADVESSPPDIAAEPVAEALPVPLMLRLETDRYLLTPGERAELTLHAWRATGASLAGLPLTLALPAPLVAAPEEQTRWALPELGEQEIFTRTVTVALRRAFTQSTAVVDVTLQSPPWQAPWLAANEATTETVHFAAQQVTLRLGLDATAAVPAAAVQAAGVTTAELREQGLVLQGSQGDVTLLVPVGSARQRSRFTYSDGYRWGGQPSTTQPSTSMTPTITTTQPNRIFLPLVSGGGEMAIAASDGITEEAFLVEDGVAFVRRWSLAATEAGRERTSFDGRLQLVVDVSWLVALGFDPERLTLYTREHREQPWEEVPSSRYEAAHERFVAQTSHFSEYGLGLHNGVVGELLPDVGAFGTELFTGAATVNYPIEVPAGAGGMAPALSLNYSTATVDSQRWENKQNQANGYRIQAGIAGLGWSLSAMNHIAFIDEGSDRFSPHDNRYSLVLNGTSTTFLDGQTLSESFARIERNLQTVTARGRKVVHTGEWTVTTRDGTRHLFGGAAISPVTAAQDANQSVMLHNIGSYHTYRVVNKWYLRKSVDSHGNWVEYNYRSFYRNTHCSTNNRYRPGWYYHSIRPASIYWGGNEQTGAGHKLRVLFGYEGRSDTGIYRRTNPCTQSIYSNERLRTIRVEVHANGAWRPLREYELGYIYTAGYYRHSWLNQIRQYGYTHRGNAPPIRTSTPLHTYSFDYTIGAIHSEVYLLNANNGWGGRVSYRYSAPATWRCEIDRRVNCDPVAYRRQVVNRYVYDGAYPTANWVRTQYGYGEGLYRRYKNDPVEFLGYPSAWAVTYKRNDYRNEAKVTEHRFYRNNGYRDRDDIANNPDPRLGHTDLEKIWQPGTSGCPRANQSRGRCLMAYTNYSYRALTGSGNNWNSTNSYSVRPRWVRQEQVVQWVDGAEKTQRFFYEPSKQNNQQFGNVTRVEEWAGGVQQRATETYYYPNRGAHLVNLPARVRVLDGAGRCVAEQRTTYDGNGGNYNRAPTKGNPSRQQRALTGCAGSSWIGDNDSGWQITLLSHDRYGNVTREMHFGTPVQSIETEYDASYHRFPVRRWSGGHQETARYYGVNGLAVTDGRAHWGQLAEWCGVNAVCTRTSYDSFGRPLRQWNGVAAGAAWNQSPASAAVHYGYYARGYGGSHTNFVVAWHAPRCYGNFVRSHYNGLGQLVQEQRPRQEWRTNIDGCNPGSYAPEVDVNYSYDALGNRIWRSVPVATGGRAINRVANWGAGYSRTEYDVLGRVSRTHAPNGERHDYDYVGRAISVVNVGLGNDGKRLVKWTQTDALGNLRSVRSYNPNGSGWQLAGQVTLTHDLLGNLTQVRHPNGIGSTTLHYDLGGRKTSMDDPDLGRWHYAHDRQGRLTRQTDARGKTTCLYYDGYGRLRGKHFRTNTSCPGSVSSYDVRYTYDQHHGSANRSRGQLTQVYYQRSGGYYKNLYYNSQGLLVREQVRIPGQGLLNSWYGYDRYQRPTTLTYPDGEVVTTWYNSMGLPAKLVSGASTTLVNGTINVHAASDAVNYDEAGRLRQMRFPAGGNLWQTRKYHSWTSGNGRLWEIRIGTGSNEAQRTNYNQLQLGYAYDSFGNVMVNSERFGLGAWPQYRHCYDGQNRLVRAYAQYATKPTKIPACDGNLPTSERYAYDEVGRFKYFNTTGTDYRYKTPQDSGHQHGVKWIDIGDGSTTNQTVKIRARGSNPNQWPRMELWINGVKKQTWTVTTGRWSDYTASVPLTGQDQIDVVFPNDNRTGGVDANLYIDWIQVNGVTYQEGQAIIDRGAGSNAFDGNDILVGGNLYWNGALRFVAGGGGTALGYDANGNMSYKLQPGAAMLYEWNHENRLATVKRNGVTTDQYLYDENGQRIKQTSMAGGTTVYVNGRYELSNEEVWVDDAIPGGATLTNGKDGWNWDTTEKVSGRAAHRSALQSGIHQHYFTNAKETMAIKSGDTLYAYIYLDPDHPPQAVMLQWNDGDWNQRAYWGQNLINWGTNGTSSRRYMGRLPASGGWVRLEVPAAQVGLAGKTVNGLAFTLYGGRAWWDRAGVRRAVHEVTKYYAFNGQRIARRQDGVLTYLHTDHLGSTLLATNSSGTMVGEHRYRAYGSRRGGDELATDHRFTSQKLDGTGLYYYNARYYDPEIGAFISPDTLVPDPTLVSDYNRFAYVRGNPLKYNDPSGHVGAVPPCPLCNVEILDYANSPGWLDSTVDGLAIVGCFFAGCNVDTQTNTVTGPTEEEYFEQLGDNLLTGGVLPIGTVTLATSRASRRLIQHGDELLGLSTVPRHVLDNALKRVDSRTLTSSGGNIVTLTKERLGHILTRHHPAYWGAWDHLTDLFRVRSSNSAFEAGLGIDDVIGLLQETLKATGNRTGRNRFEYIKEIDGKWYSASVQDDIVKSFFPCATVGCQ